MHQKIPPHLLTPQFFRDESKWPDSEDIYGNGAPVSGLDETNDQINLILDQ
ncbi:hypothetical protein ACF090_22105 [Streptomyces sp. NPDC014892]|uniref:hypothetical protein n=1 Tax=Streptomyces sp. NPDC014892 TaxID=3364930 RepID=UPI0036FA8070